MIKWLTFLLLLITIAANFSPCCSGADCCCGEVATEGHHNTGHKAAGNCSPFITCGTCPGFTQMTNTVEVPLLPAGNVFHHSKEIFFVLSSYSRSLFQPPRIA